VFVVATPSDALAIAGARAEVAIAADDAVEHPLDGCVCALGPLRASDRGKRSARPADLVGHDRDGAGHAEHAAHQPSRPAEQRVGACHVTRRREEIEMKRMEAGKGLTAEKEEG